jgi:hypothetical protein
MRHIVFSCANKVALGLHFWITERPETNHDTANQNQSRKGDI